MKKKILIVNKFFYERGGDCIYTINLKHLLEQQNHKVAIFAMQFADNINSEWEAYYPSEVCFSGSLKNKILAASRSMGLIGVKKSFTELLENFKPDIVHLNNIHSYISPIVAKLAHDRGVKVVWTLHDYKLLCPSYTFQRDNKVCELCFQNPLSVLTNKCMKKSWSASAIAYIEAKRWKKKWIESYIDAFICPSIFMSNKMRQGDYDKKKLHVLCNFIEVDKYLTYNHKISTREQAYCYIGRISKEKGINQLLKIASSLPYKLYIAGDGPLKDSLEKKYANENIIFLGKLNSEEVDKLLRRVRFSVTPSIWYENNPLSVIESLCMGTPVLSSNIGGLPELINDKNGLLFNPNDPEDLKEKIIFLFNENPFNNEIIQNNSFKRFSPQGYYSKLMEIYNFSY
jgi:glycosyltransferase involved in cell wall biosynthesis